MSDHFIANVVRVCLAIVLACFAFVCLALTGCGGGEADEPAADRQTTQPVRCNEGRCL